MNTNTKMTQYYFVCILNIMRQGTDTSGALHH